MLKSLDLFILTSNFLKERIASTFNAFAPISTFAPSVISKTPPPSAITLKLSSSITRSSTGSGVGSGIDGTTGFPPPHPTIVTNIHITRNNEITFFHIINTFFKL